jgi:hypothetical protein
LRKTICHEELRKVTIRKWGEIPKVIAALSKSWLIKEYDCNDKDTVCLPRQYLPFPNGRVCFKGHGEKSGAG